MIVELSNKKSQYGLGGLQMDPEYNLFGGLLEDPQ